MIRERIMAIWRRSGIDVDASKGGGGSRSYLDRRQMAGGAVSHAIDFPKADRFFKAMPTRGRLGQPRCRIGSFTVPPCYCTGMLLHSMAMYRVRSGMDSSCRS